MKLPTRYDLSAQGSLRSGRALASYDTSAIARGAKALGADVAAIGTDVQQQQATVDLARAEAYKTKGFIDVTNQFSEDGDYSTFGERAPKQTKDVVDKAASLIRNPAMREKWLIGAQTDAVRTNDGINDKARTLGKQAETVAFDDALETNRRIYVDPDTPEDAKAKARADIEGAISVGEQHGLLTPEQAAARRDQYVKNAEFSRAKLAVERDPSVISTPLPRTVNDRAGRAMGVLQSLGWSKEQAAGVIGNLVAESQLDTNSLNAGDGADGSDSIGVAQWNGERAKALKSFASAKGTDWKDFDTQIAFIDHELRNSPSERAAFNALQKAGDPKSAAEAMIMYERPQGSDQGVQNAHNYKGRVTAAMQAAGLEPNPEWFKQLSPEQRQVVYSQADRRRRQMSAEQQGNIENVVQNAPTAIQNTGSYDGALPGRDQFIEAYGAQDGSQRFNKFSASVDVAKESYGFRTMSADEIQSAVKEAIPTSSGDGAAIETAKYDALSKAASSTLAARKADPATYAQQAFPAVAQAWTDAAQTGNYQPAMTAMAAAQKQLGIQDVQLMPKAVAEQSVTRFKDDTLSGADRLNAVTGLVFSTPEPSQRQAVFKQLVDAGLPPTMEGAFEAMSRGDQAAAGRLMEAATVDPAKLPVDKENTPALITENVYNSVWAPGEVGYTAYGLSYGDASSLQRAQRGTELLSKAVRLRLARGEEMQGAIDGAKKDLFGDKIVFNGYSGVSADIAVDPSTDQGALNAGLNASKDVFRQALDAQRQRALGVPADKFMAQPNPQGLVAPGNVDLTTRPKVKNEDGSVSTVRSMSFEEDGVEVLVPTVSDDGRMLSDQEAIDSYRQTGKFLGKFKSPAEADKYAEALHNQQDKAYLTDPGQKAIVETATENWNRSILQNGVFVETGDGIGMRDPYTGQFVLGTNGKPLTLSVDDVLKQAPSAEEQFKANAPSVPANRIKRRVGPEK